MQNVIKVFENAEFGNVRTILNGETVLFCGKDVAEALGYKRTADAIASHCKGVCEIPTPTAGGTQMMKYIREGDLYRLIAHSDLPSAQRFESWVFDEVLPSIRTTGTYLSPTIDSAFLYKMAKQMEEKERELAVLTSVNATLLPKAEFYDAIIESPDTIDMGRVAKVLNIGVERNTIFAILRDNGVLQQNNIPYQRYVDMGYFRCIETKYTKPDGTICVSIKTVVFQKGVDFIRRTVTKHLNERGRNTYED